MLPIGDALAEPPTPAQQATQVAGAPPPTPAEVETNKGLWGNFMNKIKTDPNFRQAVLQTGLGLMRSQKVGENAGDVASQALGNGVATLDLLRQRDRTQQIDSAEMKRKAGLEERKTQVDESQGRSTAQVAATGVRREDRESTNFKSQYDLAKMELDEAIRSNKRKEDIDALKAQADMLRARAYSSAGGAGGGRTPQEIQKIENLTAQRVARGEDPVEARAASTREVISTSRTGSLLDNVDEIVKQRSEQYMFSEDARDKPMTMEMLTQWRKEAIEQVRGDVASFGSGSAPPAPLPAHPVTPTPGQPQTSPTGPPGTAVAPPQPTNVPVAASGPPPEPAIAQSVQAALARGVQPGQVRQRLLDLGKDPAAYGL